MALRLDRILVNIRWPSLGKQIVGLGKYLDLHNNFVSGKRSTLTAKNCERTKIGKYGNSQAKKLFSC